MKKIWNYYFRWNVPFFIFAGLGMILLVVSWITPPPFKIDPSVLQGCSLILGFNALWTVHAAIMKGGKGKLKHGHTELEVSAEDKNERED